MDLAGFNVLQKVKISSEQLLKARENDFLVHFECEVLCDSPQNNLLVWKKGEGVAVQFAEDVITGNRPIGIFCKYPDGNPFRESFGRVIAIRRKYKRWCIQ